MQRRVWNSICVYRRSEEGLFPHENSTQEEYNEEERRLMYVAITRARKRLYYDLSQTRMLHGQTRYNLRSRFFDEMPEVSLKWLSPRVQASWFGRSKSAWDDAPEVGAKCDCTEF